MGGDYKRLLAGVWSQTPRALSDRLERTFFFLTLASIGLAVAVRLYGLDYSFWGDEIASVTFARQPVERLWSDWMMRETNPPLYYTLLHFWMAAFGSSDLAVKLLSVLLGTGNVIVVALIARRLGESWLPALVTALFVGLHPYHIFYSQNARGYMLAALAASLACLAIVRIVTKHNDGSAHGGAARDWAVFGLAMLAALYSHTTMAVFYVTINLMIALWIAVTARKGRVLTSWVVANLAIAAGYAWWIWITLHQLGPNENFGNWPDLYFWDGVYLFLEIFAPQPEYLRYGAAAILVVPLALYALTQRWGAAIMVLCGTAFAFFYLGSKLTVIMHERTILWIYPLFAVGLGLAAARIRRGAVAVAVVAASLTLSGLAYHEDFPEREWARWPDIVALANTDPTVPVFVSVEPFDLSFDHYCNQRFGKCPIRLVVVRTPLVYPWAQGLSGRPVMSQRAAWSTGSPVIRTVEWIDGNLLLPDRHPCSATDQSPAYRLVGEPVDLGDNVVKTWRLREGCSGR